MYLAYPCALAGTPVAPVAGLGLAPSTRKVPVNFTGCFGGFTALFVAKAIVEADASGAAVVLVVAAETCTVHYSDDARAELMVGSAASHVLWTGTRRVV